MDQLFKKCSGKRELMQNHIIVIGGSKGLGKQVVARYLAQGFLVTVLSRNAPPEKKNLRHIYSDLNEIDKINELVSQAIDGVGYLNYLIFCQRYRGVESDWVGEMQVSLTATKMLIDGFSNFFVNEGDRAIGVVSSVYAESIGGSQPLSYHVAKAGLNQMVRYYAWVLGRKGIRINSIMPLTYLKNESRNFYVSNEKLMRFYKELVPIGRIGDAQDSVNLLEFLCSDKAAFINGQNIYIDGGLSVIWPEELAKSMSEFK
jgi:NAD(P)-dependent dehydrogenase (short-subunit alcohol dehydrogenase family)